MKRAYLLVFIAFFMLVFEKSNAQQLSENTRVSILTCEPGTEVYSMYGHTAIRVNDPESGLDAVFNYGVFSFDSPDFVYRFAKGYTDYLMIGQRFDSFITEYETDKRSVYEQILNISYQGKIQLFNALIENAKPENRVYRYNFFVDNCATRVRDMIENNSGNKVTFSSSIGDQSFRDLIKHYHKPFSWVDLGIDLLVGLKADVPVTEYGQMFLPEFLLSQFASAKIEIDGKNTPLVSETITILKFPNNKLAKSLPWPTLVFGVIFLVILLISVMSIKSAYKGNYIDYWLFGLSGLAGIIIGWFTLFSEHPAMSPNYNLLWAMPLNLVFAIIWKFRNFRNISKVYFYFSGIMLLSLLFVNQQINMACMFIAASIIVRIVYILLTVRKTSALV